MSLDLDLVQREAEGRPIRVGLVGAGATGRAIALQLGTPVPGMRLVAVANRTLANAERALREAEMPAGRIVTSVKEADAAIQRGIVALTDDAHILANADHIDVLVEATGTID